MRPRPLEPDGGAAEARTWAPCSALSRARKSKPGTRSNPSEIRTRWRGPSRAARRPAASRRSSTAASHASSLRGEVVRDRLRDDAGIAAGLQRRDPVVDELTSRRPCEPRTAAGIPRRAGCRTSRSSSAWSIRARPLATSSAHAVGLDENRVDGIGVPDARRRAAEMRREAVTPGGRVVERLVERRGRVHDRAAGELLEVDPDEDVPDGRVRVEGRRRPGDALFRVGPAFLRRGGGALLRRLEEVDRLDLARDPDLEVCGRQAEDGPVLAVHGDDVEHQDGDLLGRRHARTRRRRGRRLRRRLREKRRGEEEGRAGPKRPEDGRTHGVPGSTVRAAAPVRRSSPSCPAWPRASREGSGAGPSCAGPP